MSEDKDLHRANILIPRELWEAAKRKAARLGESMSTIIRQFLREWTAEEDKETAGTDSQSKK